jgi:hypothetical protein
VSDEGCFRAARSRPGPRVHGPRPGSSRRPRWDSDAGITERDVAALVWLGQQYAARSDVLRVLLGRLSPGGTRVEGLLGETTLRDVLDRWDDRGLIARDRLLGHVWAAPPRKRCGWSAWTCAPGRSSSPARPRPRRRVVRLALEPSIPLGGRWVSERELRGESTRHMPDGAIELPDNPDGEAGSGARGQRGAAGAPQGGGRLAHQTGRTSGPGTGPGPRAPRRGRSCPTPTSPSPATSPPTPS